ncbi:MAG: VanZ family protein [Lachnospiraceae bacterium]|nr:VanZ family protein [Lachnospiraceae bacterium]
MTEFTIFDRPFQFLATDDQWTKLENYLDQYLFSNVYGQYALLLLLIITAGFLLSLILRGYLKKTLNIVLFLSYSIVLILLFIAGRDTAQGFRIFTLSDYLTDTGFHETRVLISLLNAVFFAPFGVFLRKASGKGHAIVNIFVVVMAAGGIEIAQYVFSRGYTALEDVLMYVLGGFAGLIIAAPFCMVSEYMENSRRGNRHHGSRKKKLMRNEYDEYFE